MDREKTVRPLGWRVKVGYMFGDFGNDFTFLFASTFLMIFYTKVLGISMGLVGTLFLTARCIDAFTDVTMGRIVDRMHPKKDGRFRPWLRRMCAPVAISSFLMYQSSLAGASMTVKVIYMFVTYILWGSIFYTSINIHIDIFFIPFTLGHRDLRIHGKCNQKTMIKFLHFFSPRLSFYEKSEFRRQPL